MVGSINSNFDKNYQNVVLIVKKGAFVIFIIIHSPQMRKTDTVLLS
jgi:hypothetical protein